MRDVYLVALAVTDYENQPRAAGLLVTAREGADENEVGLDAAALLPTTDIRRIESMTVERISDDIIKAIGLIALAKGLI